MATWKTTTTEEDEDMGLDKLTDNETTRFFITLLKYFGQQVKSNWFLMWGGGTGMIKGLLGLIALLIVGILIVYVGVQLFTGGIDGDVRGINIPQAAAIVMVILVFISACVPASATAVDDDYETEIVDETVNEGS